MQLFRPEALRGQDRLHGDVALVPPVSWRVMGLFLFGTLAVAALFLATAHYAPVTAVAGTLTGDRGIVRAFPEDAVPAGTGLQAEFHVPPAAAGFLERGQAIRIAVDAYPYQTYGTVPARVDFISAATIPVALPDGSGTIEAFLVQATLDREAVEAFGRERPLRPGMTVRARITTRSRSLAEWLFEPLYAVARR